MFLCKSLDFARHSIHFHVSVEVIVSNVPGCTDNVPEYFVVESLYNVPITLFGATPEFDTVMSKQFLIFVCREEVGCDVTVRSPFLSANTFIKPTRCTNFTNLFCHETVCVSDSSSVHHQEFIHYKLTKGICHTGL